MSKKILITGGTGLIGKELSELLRLQGHDIRILSRSKKEHKFYKFFTWDIDKGTIEDGALEVDYIIHLAGAGIADKRWTEKRKKIIIDSRVESTRLLARKLKEKKGPKPSYIGASAIGIYGNQDSHPLKEEEVSEDKDSFLVEVTKKWEAAHQELKELVGQWAIIRIGIVLSKNGGVLEKLLIPFKFRMANYFGDGSQVFSWIHINELCRIFSFIIENEISGIYNGVAPKVVNGREMVSAIADIKSGPYLKFGAPEFALKVALGDMSEAVLMSTWASAESLIKKGFIYEYEEVKKALEDLLG